MDFRRGSTRAFGASLPVLAFPRGTALPSFRLRMGQEQVALLALTREDGPAPAERRHMPELRMIRNGRLDVD